MVSPADKWFRQLADDFGCNCFEIHNHYISFRMHSIADTARDGRRTVSMRLQYYGDRGEHSGNVGFAASQITVHHPDVAAGRPVPHALVLGRDECANNLADHLSAVVDDALQAGVRGGFVGVAGYDVPAEHVESVARRLAERLDAGGDVEVPADPQPMRRYGGPLGGQERYEFPASLPGVPADAGARRVHIRQAFGGEIRQHVELCWLPTPSPSRGWRFWRRAAPQNQPDWDHLRTQAEKSGVTGPWIVLGGADPDGTLTLRSVDLLGCSDPAAAEAHFAAAVGRVLSSQGG